MTKLSKKVCLLRLQNRRIGLLGRTIRCALLIISFLFLLPGPTALASNPVISGTGCKATSGGADVEDRLFQRHFVVLGPLDEQTPVLNSIVIETLKGTRVRRAVPEGVFLRRLEHDRTGKRLADGDMLLADRFMLLINAANFGVQEIRESPVVVKALASSVPIVLENFTPEHMKSLIGLGLTTDAALLQAEPGGREVTITGIDLPVDGVTPKFVLDRINRGLANRFETPSPEGEQVGLGVGDAYATKQWTVWLHSGNILCAPPYNKAPPFPEHQDFDVDLQEGSVNIGVVITLVAGTSDAKNQKAIDFLYTGSGAQPLAEGEKLIGDNSLFRGAQTIALRYDTKLTAPEGAKLETISVEPNSAINQHTVTKTNGWRVGLTSSCGGSVIGPQCSIGALFNFSSSTSETEDISQRNINASRGQSNVKGNTEATHSVEYVLGATKRGHRVDPFGNWNGFFEKRSICVTPLFKDGSGFEAYALGPFCLPQDHPWDFIAVHDFPDWTSSAALTKGEAGYVFDKGFTGDLTYDVNFDYTVGIFAFGWGNADDRRSDEVTVTPFGCGSECPYYILRQYVEAFEVKNKRITINAEAVNFSGLPTCEGFNLEQKDLGVWKVVASEKIQAEVDVSRMALLDSSTGKLIQKPAFSEDFQTQGEFGLAVSAPCNPPNQPNKECPPVIMGGQTEYVALCSNDQVETGVAMSLLYSFTPSGGSEVKGGIGFDGAGKFVDQKDPHIKVDKTNRSITITTAITPAIYDVSTKVVDQITVSVGGKPYSVSLRYDSNSGKLYLNEMVLLDEMPENFNAEYDPETKIALLHSVQINNEIIRAKLKFEGDDTFSILEIY